MKNSFLIYLFLLVSIESKAQKLQEGFKEINGAQIYYKQIGKDEPILVIHGGPGLDHSYLYRELKDLSKNFQLIFYDQRLSGKSSAIVDTNTVSLNGFIDDIEGLRKQLQLKKITILSHSFGGLLAMKYALKYPQNIKSLILVSSISPDSKENIESEKIIKKRFTTIDSLDKVNIIVTESYKTHEVTAYNKLMKLGFENQIYKYKNATKLNIDLPKDFFQRSKQLQYLRKDFSGYNFYSELKQISCPVLLIYGDFDPLSVIAANKIKDKFPNSTLIIFKECGHFPFLEKQKEFNKTVLNWYKTSVYYGKL